MNAERTVKLDSFRVTMASVAAQAGVSRMTVSRALRDSPEISLETRTRIKHVAREMGFRPDPQISQFMARVRVSRQVGAETIAWLTAHPERDGWKGNSACKAFHAGACLRAAEAGYRLEEFWLGAPGMTARRMSAILRNRGIRGVLVAPLDKISDTLDLRWDLFATATCGGYTLAKPQLHRASCNYLHSVKNAFENLNRLGYRRIGLAVSQSVSLRLADEWLAQIYLEQSRLPASHRVMPFLAKDWYAACPDFMKWYHRQKPDAVLSFEHVLDWLPRHGVRIPQDCAVALIAIPMEGVAHIDEQREEIGAAAVDLIIEQLNMNKFGIPATPKVVQINCKWIDGPTAPPRLPEGTTASGKPAGDSERPRNSRGSIFSPRCSA